MQKYVISSKNPKEKNVCFFKKHFFLILEDIWMVNFHNFLKIEKNLQIKASLIWVEEISGKFSESELPDKLAMVLRKMHWKFQMLVIWWLGLSLQIVHDFIQKIYRTMMVNKMV